jgi:hypothetical protein
MRELLDIATLYATSEEAVQVNFSGKTKAASHLSGGDGADDPTSSQRRRDRQNKDRKHYREEMVACGRLRHQTLAPRARCTPGTLREGAQVPPPIPWRADEASSQGLRYHEGLHP